MFVTFCLLVIAPLVGTAAEVDYGPAIDRLRAIVKAELDREILGGVAIALVDDQEIVFAEGFGYADKRRKIPATSKSIYRAGSISKLFTAVAAMQLVEQGKLDLDRPVADYIPGFGLVVPFADAGPITLRHFMCHRSGMIRESPIGGYLDPNEPSIAETVASIAPCVLVLQPNTQTKYSNVGPTIVGRAIELAAGTPYAEHQRENLLKPLGMTSSSFLLTDDLKDRYAPGYMLVADGQGGFNEIEAPRFELGTLPAGNLYTTSEDLARFLMFLLAEGRSGDRQILKPESLKEMFTVQLQSAKAGFGLGFSIGKFREHRMVSHMGAVYGHTASAAALPEAKLGVVVLANEDIAMGPVRKLADAGMSLLLEAKLGEEPPALEMPIEVDPSELAKFAGDFESQSYWSELKVVDGVLHVDISGLKMTLTPVGENRFLANGRYTHRAACVFKCDESGNVTGFSLSNQNYTRVDPTKITSTPDDWQAFLGSYGPEFIPLVISIKHGHLYAMTENMVDYRLTPLNRTVFQMPLGMYIDEQLIFQVGADGKTHSVILANMQLPRRQ